MKGNQTITLCFRWWLSRQRVVRNTEKKRAPCKVTYLPLGKELTSPSSDSKCRIGRACFRRDMFLIAVLSPILLLVVLHAFFVFNNLYGPPLSLAANEMTNFAQNCVLPPPFLPLPLLHSLPPLIYPHVRPCAQVTIYDYQYWRLEIMIIPFGAELCCYWLAQRHKYGYDSCAEWRGACCRCCYGCCCCSTQPLTSLQRHPLSG